MACWHSPALRLCQHILFYYQYNRIYHILLFVNKNFALILLNILQMKGISELQEEADVSPEKSKHFMLLWLYSLMIIIS